MDYEWRLYGTCWRCENENVQLLPDPLDEDGTIEQALCFACFMFTQQIVEETDNAENG